MGFVSILDENLFRKKKKALRRYFPKAYKYLEFEVTPILMKSNKKDGIYELQLPTDELFNKTYGKMMLKFSVKNDNALIEDIVPNDILIACYEKSLPIYKGVPYSTEKDLKKIKIVERLI